MQSHLLKGKSPTYGPVTEQLVEYGIARLREGHKGEIVEPLAFLSLMRWLQGQGHLNLEANLRLRLGNKSERGSSFEEVGNLYLLRALRHAVSFTTVFNFRCTPSWADETAHIIARLGGKDIAVDGLGEAPENPGLSVVHYASSIEDAIDWLDKPDNASALLIPSQHFGPDVMARCCSSSSNTTVLLMGQYKSYTDGNKESLEAETVAQALTSLHPDHWFKQAVCYLAHYCSHLIKDLVAAVLSTSETHWRHRETRCPPIRCRLPLASRPEFECRVCPAGNSRARPKCRVGVIQS